MPYYIYIENKLLTVALGTNVVSFVKSFALTLLLERTTRWSCTTGCAAWIWFFIFMKCLLLKGGIQNKWLEFSHLIFPPVRQALWPPVIMESIELDSLCLHTGLIWSHQPGVSAAGYRWDIHCAAATCVSHHVTLSAEKHHIYMSYEYVSPAASPLFLYSCVSYISTCHILKYFESHRSPFKSRTGTVQHVLWWADLLTQFPGIWLGQTIQSGHTCRDTGSAGELWAKASKAIFCC